MRRTYSVGWFKRTCMIRLSLLLFFLIKFQPMWIKYFTQQSKSCFFSKYFLFLWQTIYTLLFKSLEAKHWFQLFIWLCSPQLIWTTNIMFNRSSDLWLISTNGEGWNLQTGNSALRYVANDKVWVPIRGQYMRSRAANGLKQKQCSHFRCKQKGNRGRVNG